MKKTVIVIVESRSLYVQKTDFSRRGGVLPLVAGKKTIDFSLVLFTLGRLDSEALRLSLNQGSSIHRNRKNPETYWQMERYENDNLFDDRHDGRCLQC
jgi:hypothetical protein